MARRLAVVAIAGLLTGGIVVAARVAQSGDAVPQRGQPYVKTFATPKGSVELLLASGDGQFFAAIAQDPTLSDPSVFPTDGEAAYRASRPLLSYIAWAAALGTDDRVGVALAVLVAVSCGLATGACGGLAGSLGESPLLGVAVLVLPGSLAVMHGLGGEMLALGLTAIGLTYWLGQPRKAWEAAVFFTLAGLTRETMLVVPIALAVREMTARGRRRSLLPLAIPPVALVAWMSVVRLRIGVWPESSDRLGIPFDGFLQAIDGWENPVPNLLVIALGVSIGTVVALRARSHPLAIVALAYVPVAIVAGPDVWHAWENFSRPLLPLFAFGLIAVAATLRPTLTGDGG